MVKIDQNNSPKKIDEELFNILKKGAKLMGIVTSNPTLRKFLRTKGIPIYGKGMVFNLKNILLSSIDSDSYDNRFQKYLNNQEISFFSDLVYLINECTKKSKTDTEEILNKFLSIIAIRQLQKTDPNIIWSTLFNLYLLEIIIEYQEQIPFNGEEFMSKIFECATDSLQKANMLKDLPDQFEKVAENIVNEIKNNRESTRYVAGLICGLLDLLNEDFKNPNHYFNERYSAKFHYYGPSYRYNRCCWIGDYLNPILYQNQADRYKSFKLIFEDWFFNTIEKIRHFKGHSEKDIIQDKLETGIYKIYTKEKQKSVILESKLEDLQSYYEKSYDLLLLSKHIVARKLYLNDDELFNYLAEPYEFD